MPTQRELDDLAADYKRAKRLVAQAQLIIAETNWTANPILGMYGPATAHGLFSAMDELRVNFNRAYQIITAAKPDTPSK